MAPRSPLSERLPDTITDRAVNIDLKRRGPGETVARFRIRRDSPELAPGFVTGSPAGCVTRRGSPH